MQGGGQPSSSQQQGQGQPQQGSQDPQAQEKTPEKPGEKPGGEKPESQGDPKSAQQGEPNSPKDSKAEPQNTAGGPPPKLATAVVDADKANQQWGDLPPTVRDLFRTEGGSDLPPQYRDWIDAYYRRLNRERR